ncbi:MAG: flippase-like domain-containing protein [Candidatus Omnitrophica bacterium]|nr:flippase-like domain-containing protein [Candidatus Omnitrophota bacterium]
MGNLIRILISLAFLGIFAYVSKDSIPEVLNAVRDANHLYLAIGVGSYILACFAMGFRLKAITKALSLRFSAFDSVCVTFIGYFFNNFLPTAVGGDIIKTYCLIRKTGDKTLSIASVLADRLYGLLMFLLIPSLAVVFMRNQLPDGIVYMVYCALAGGVVCVISIFFYGKISQSRWVSGLKNRPGIFASLIRIYESVYRVAVHPVSAVKVCCFSIIGQLLSISSVYWIIKSLMSVDGMGLPGYLLMAVPIVNLLSMIPSINGLGVREVGYVYFLTKLMSQELALTVALIFFSYLLVLSLIGAVIYMLRSDMHFDFSFLKRQKTPESMGVKS